MRPQRVLEQRMAEHDDIDATVAPCVALAGTNSACQSCVSQKASSEASRTSDDDAGLVEMGQRALRARAPSLRADLADLADRAR